MMVGHEGSCLLLEKTTRFWNEKIIACVGELLNNLVLGDTWEIMNYVHKRILFSYTVYILYVCIERNTFSEEMVRKCWWHRIFNEVGKV